MLIVHYYVTIVGAHTSIYIIMLLGTYFPFIIGFILYMRLSISTTYEILIRKSFQGVGTHGKQLCTIKRNEFFHYIIIRYNIPIGYD